MALGDITDEIRKHYAWMRRLQADIPSQLRLPEVIADALRDQLAARRKLAFKVVHRETFDWKCVGCMYDEPDLRHNWTDENWRAAAETELSVGA